MVVIILSRSSDNPSHHQHPSWADRLGLGLAQLSFSASDRQHLISYYHLAITAVLVFNCLPLAISLDFAHPIGGNLGYLSAVTSPEM